MIGGVGTRGMSKNRVAITTKEWTSRRKICRQVEYKMLVVWKFAKDVARVKNMRISKPYEPFWKIVFPKKIELTKVGLKQTKMFFLKLLCDWWGTQKFIKYVEGGLFI